MKINLNRKIKGFVLLVLLVSLLGIAGVARADVSYDAGRNTIFLESGTNTLASIDADPDVPGSALNYNSETNTYTLSAYISGKDGVNANLYLKDATLIFNNPTPSTSANPTIKTWADLVIDNMTLKAANPVNYWLIQLYYRYTQYWLSVTDSDISGGHIIYGGGSNPPRAPFVIKNNNFHDTTIPGEYGFEYIVKPGGDGYNNTFTNCHITSGAYNGIISEGSWDKLYISNSSVSSYGAVFNANLSNFEIKDVTGVAIGGKEWGGRKISDGTITNVSKAAIQFYHSVTYGNTKYWVWNVNIEGASEGIMGNGYDDLTADIYNVSINNIGTAYAAIQNKMVFYITNSKTSNYTTLYSFQGGGEIREYQLADIYVIDLNGNPVANAAVTITAENSDVANPVINRKLIDGTPQATMEAITQTNTLSHGHTPLPAEDEAKTVALLRLRKTSISEKSDYTYTITAEKDGVSASLTGIKPDASWYRIDPNTYQNTVVITLPMVLTPSAIDINLDGVIDISDLRIVALHFGESTTLPYPRYDVDANGTVDILDLRQVAGGM